MRIAVVGAGLAGSECAWILAEKYGLKVTLFEMKSRSPTPAQSEPHHFAELVCSNSLKSKSRLNPAGLLKSEMAALGSLVIPTAFASEVPAGEALAVDREKFSGAITQRLKAHPNIQVVETVVTSLGMLFEQDTFAAAVIATGPLTADPLAESLRTLTGSSALYFYDAIAPIIDGETIDMDIAFRANRQTRTATFENREETEGDYLNLPMNKDEYYSFVQSLIEGDKVPYHNFEDPKFFNGCQPIEVLAQSGPRTLSFGPLKARGLVNPRTGRIPYAAVQLRKEKVGDTAFNMVGCQTRLTWPAQKRIFKTIPGLENAEFFRLGSMHRNTYLISPEILNPDFTLKASAEVYLAGQVMGVEGYLESAAMGLWIGHVIGKKFAQNSTAPLPPQHTALGCLCRHTLETEAKHFSPMNIHWGLFNELQPEDVENFGSEFVSGELGRKKLDKSVKRSLLASRAEAAFSQFINTFNP